MGVAAVIAWTLGVGLSLAPAQLPPTDDLGPQLPPLPCLPDPIPILPCDPVPPPLPGDEPPKLAHPRVLPRARSSSRIVIVWTPATDDVGIAGYRLWRDGRLLGERGRRVTRASLAMPCGRHAFRLEAVDLAGQTDERRLRARRVCRR